MIDRAALAGIAIGAGAVLIAQQLFATTPLYVPIFVGFLLVLLGGVAWGDLRFQRERQERVGRRAETDR
jgi:fatty acid desaturase